MLLLQQRSLFTEKCFGKMTNGRFLVPRPPRTNRHVVLDVNKKCRGLGGDVCWVRTRVKLTWIYLWLKCHFKKTLVTIVSLQTRIVVDLCKQWNLVATEVRCVFMFAFRHRLFNAPKIAQTGASPSKFATFFAYLLQDFRHHVFAGFRCGFALSDGYVF